MAFVRPKKIGACSKSNDCRPRKGEPFFQTIHDRFGGLGGENDADTGLPVQPPILPEIHLLILNNDGFGLFEKRVREIDL